MRGRRIPSKAKNPSRVIHLGKGPFYFALAFLSLAAYAIWSTSHITLNSQYTRLGKSIDCVERPSYDYFAFCSPLHDGPACSLASQSRMLQFYEPIDFACAQYEPKRRFVFPAYSEPAEFANAGTAPF